MTICWECENIGKTMQVFDALSRYFLHMDKWSNALHCDFYILNFLSTCKWSNIRTNLKILNVMRKLFFKIYRLNATREVYQYLMCEELLTPMHGFALADKHTCAHMCKWDIKIKAKFLLTSEFVEILCAILKNNNNNKNALFIS